MKKNTYLALALMTSSFLFSCKSKQIALKDGASVVRSGEDAWDLKPTNNVTKTERGLMMTIDSDLLFPTNSSYLTDAAKGALNEFVTLAKKHPQALIQIDGHTDATGTEEYNQWLSEKRAASVKVYLEGLGISGNRMTIKGYGQANPVAPNQTKEGRQKNRRVEITILQ